jgi:hypothetical protein
MNNFLIGTTGVSIVEGVDFIPSTTPTVEIVKIAIQLIIGIVTLFKMFKKPKEVISNQNSQN